MSFDPKNWMGMLSPSKKREPLIYIAIPGSHDSMTYTIRKGSPVAPDAEPFLRSLIKYTGFIVRPFVYKWCLTQSDNVTQQLALGIRYFDLRLATKERSNDYFIVHGLYGDNVVPIFNEIIEYLRAHENEVVILDMQHFYAFSDEDHVRYIRLLKETFAGFLCPPPDNLEMVTLDWMINNGYRVLIIYRDKNGDRERQLLNGGRWPTPWPETMSPSEMIKFLDLRVRSRPVQRGLVSQCILTPTNSTIFRHVFSSVRGLCAVPALVSSIPWLSSLPPRVLNVAIADFVSLNNADFPNTVISLNFK